MIFITSNEFLPRNTTFIRIPLMLFVRLTKGAYFSPSPQFEMAQQLLIFLLAITGAYLFLIPYIVKGQRKRRNRQLDA